MKTRQDYARFGKTVLAAAMLSALLLFVAVPRLQADGRAKCQRNIERAEARLDNAVHKYGGNSRITIDRWHELNAERERCFNLYHGWWDGRAHVWRDGRDWGHYDQERGWRYGP